MCSRSSARRTSRGENPAFYRNPTPSVDDDREAAIIGADAQSEERVPIRLQEGELDPVLFQQSTYVADWLLEADSNRFPRGLHHLRRVG